MWRFAALAVLLLASQAARACECGFLASETTARAEVAFVFQIVSAELHVGQKDDLLDDGVVARIRVVQNLRGKSVATHISYTTNWCCGMRLTVGGYYAAFLPANPRSFTAGLDNIVALSPLYQPSSKLPDELRRLLRGTKGAELFLQQSYERLSQAPSPPCLSEPSGL